MAEVAVASRAPDALREPWSELSRQREAATLGMWLFLMSEMLFFGALFMAFSFSRALDPAAFAEAARHAEIAYGAANTAVLVTSSLTITIAVRAADAAHGRLAARLLAATAVLGVAFLVIKGFEYRDDLRHHLFPGHDFALGRNATQIFWAFYWAMTGVHAIHLTVGVALVLRLFWLVRRGANEPRLAAARSDVALLASGRRVLDRAVPNPLRGGPGMTAKAQRVAWLGPILAWVVLLCATAAVAWLGVEASGRLRFGGALTVAALMLGTLAFGLVGVGRNPGPPEAGRRGCFPISRTDVPAELRGSHDPSALRGPVTRSTAQKTEHLTSRRTRSCIPNLYDTCLSPPHPSRSRITR